jgi:hypothetical protein
MHPLADTAARTTHNWETIGSRSSVHPPEISPCLFEPVFLNERKLRKLNLQFRVGASTVHTVTET